MYSDLIQSPITGPMWTARAMDALEIVPDEYRSIETMPHIKDFFRMAKDSNREDFLYTLPGYTTGSIEITKITRQQMELIYIAMLYMISPELEKAACEELAHSLAMV